MYAQRVAHGGAGCLNFKAARSLHTPLAFAAIILLSVLGLFLYGLIEWSEHLCIPWNSVVKSSLKDGEVQ